MNRVNSCYDMSMKNVFSLALSLISLRVFNLLNDSIVSVVGRQITLKDGKLIRFSYSLLQAVFKL